MANHVVEVGRPVTSATTGSIVALVGAPCKLLGIFTGATTTLTIYDAATSAQATALGAIVPQFAALAIGWNRLPLDLLNGLAVNQGAQLLFVVQG